MRTTIPSRISTLITASPAVLKAFLLPARQNLRPHRNCCNSTMHLAKDLGLDPVALDSKAGLEIFSGNVTPEGSEPARSGLCWAPVGGFVPQLGDGRALLLGEVIDTLKQRRDIQLKGSGRTPFSRGGDW